MRDLSFADTALLHDAMLPHWKRHPVLGNLRLELSNPPRGTTGSWRPRLIPPFALIVINPSRSNGIMLTVTVWHPDDQLLVTWKALVHELFTVDPFVFEGQPYRAIWHGKDSPPKIIATGSKYADENGVMPWVLSIHGTLIRPGDGSVWDKYNIK